MIVGILHMYSKIKYGYNKRNTPIYLFTPFNRDIPNYKIASSEKDTSHNQLAIVEDGHLVRLLGRVGDPIAEGNAMYLHYSPFAVYTKSIKEKLLSSIQTDRVERVDITHLPTINVDPNGTIDIDDIVSFDLPYIYITIADVSSFVPIDSELDKHARKIGQTLYHPALKPHTMFPPEFEEMASLLPEQVRPGVSLRYNVDTYESVFMLTTIRNQQTHTYDSIHQSKWSAVLSDLSAKLGKSSTDSHEWIETMMVHYNCEVAKLLSMRKTGLFRAFEGVVATYTQEEAIHSGFGRLYCHATSPLRRYADIVNQRVLHAYLTQSNDTSVPNPEELNILQKQSKRFARDSFFVDLILKSPMGTVDAVVSEVTETHIRFYVPEWKLTLKKSVENVVVGQSICLDYLAQPEKLFWKDRVLFRLTSDTNYQEP